MIAPLIALCTPLIGEDPSFDQARAAARRRG